MSSGIPRLLRRIYALVLGERKRLAELSRTGKTISVEDICDGLKIVAVDLGYGIEFWTTPTSSVEFESTGAIKGGQLILTASSRVAREHHLTERGIPFRRVYLRF